MKKVWIFIITIILLAICSFFVYKKYNEVPDEYIKFNEYGITYEYNENHEDYTDKYFYNQLDETEKYITNVYIILLKISMLNSR